MRATLLKMVSKQIHQHQLALSPPGMLRLFMSVEKQSFIEQVRSYRMKYTDLDNVIRLENEDGSMTFIPIDKSNADYQRYLRWLKGEDESGTIS